MNYPGYTEENLEQTIERQFRELRGNRFRVDECIERPRVACTKIHPGGSPRGRELTWKGGN